MLIALSKPQPIFGKKLLIALFAFLLLAGCGSNSDTVMFPGVLSLNSTTLAPVNTKLGGSANGVILFETQANATFQDQGDFFQISVIGFTADSFADPGIPIQFKLNQNLPSGGVIAKLGPDGMPFQPHHLTFNLTVTVDGQELQYNNIKLMGTNPNITLAEPVPPMTFTTPGGNITQLQITGMRKALVGELIDTTITCGDCPCNFAAIPKTSDCWTNDKDLTDAPDFTPGDVCILSSNDGADFVSFSVQQTNKQCFIQVENPTCLSADTPNPAGNATLTDDEITACKCQLEQYSTDLDNTLSFFGVIGGPPFSCVSDSN